MSRHQNIPPLRERVGICLSLEHRAWLEAQTRDSGAPISEVVRRLIEKAATASALDSCGCAGDDHVVGQDTVLHRQKRPRGSDPRRRELRLQCE